MTTNGIGLVRLASPLAAAGLAWVNGSLDTLSPATTARLARRDQLASVVRGLDATADAGLAPVKVNAVLMRGINDTEGYIAPCDAAVRIAADLAQNSAMDGLALELGQYECLRIGGAS